VDAIVFWSKNPAPLIPGLKKLDEIGYRYYFQFTLNDYPRELESSVPPLKARINTFIKLSGLVGKKRVIWRYDPIILSNRTGTDYHMEKFSSLCNALGGFTERVMTSLVTYYVKTRRNLSPLEKIGYRFHDTDESQDLLPALLPRMAECAAKHKIKIHSCASEFDFQKFGIPPGRCIDAELINELWGLDLSAKKDTGQRKHCLCAASKDIGMNDTCVHNCPYCYSTKNHEKAVKAYKEHDKDSPVLTGEYPD
jgi:hypothetical protein